MASFAMIAQADLDAERLVDAIEWSYRQTETFRAKEKDFVRQFIGKHHSDQGSEDKVPVNVTHMLVTTQLRSVMARAPQCLVTSPYIGLGTTADKLERGLNYLIREINAENEWNAAALSAMFGMGVCRYGLKHSGHSVMDNVNYRSGQPFVRRISIHDFVQDMDASLREEQQFRGSRYFLSKKAIQRAAAMGEYDPEVLPKLMAFDGRMAGQMADHESETARINHDTPSSNEIYRDKYELWDIYLPFEECTWEGRVYESCIATMQLYGDSGLLVGVRPWIGPRIGPFDVLNYTEIPDNALPLAPVSVLYDLHTIINRLWNKATRQAENAKSLIAAQINSVEDAERMVDARDRTVVPVRGSPGDVNVLTFPGADAPTVALVIQAYELYKQLGGNLDAQAGLGPQAETLGQDEMITAAANKQLAVMRDRTMDFIRKGVRRFADMLFYDPLIELPLTYEMELPGVGRLSAMSQLTPEDMQGEFAHYNIDIDTYSAQHRTPQTEVQSMMTIYREMLPIMPMAQAQGIMFDIQGFLRRLSKLLGHHYLDDMFVFQQPPRTPQQPPAGAMPSRGVNTTRTTIRRNIPGATNNGKSAAMIGQLLNSGSGGQQPGIAAQIGRPN